MDIWEAFGFRRGDAFLAAPRFEWTGLRRAVNRMRRAVANREWVLIYGPPGAGKTEALRAFADGHGDGCWLANVTALRRRMMHTNVIAEAVLMDLRLEELGEKPAQQAERRTRQVTRLIGVRAEEKPVAVVMDEASSFSLDLINDVKHLRDLRWSGRTNRTDRRPPFAIIMCGWEALSKRLAASRQSEIRVMRDEMPPMSLEEVGGFLDHVGFRQTQIGHEAREAIWRAARYPGEVAHAVAQGMERALIRGRREVLAGDIQQGNMAGLKAKMSKLNIQLAEVARVSGQSRSTVCRVLNDGYAGKSQTHAHVLQTVARLVEDREAMQTAERPSKRLAV